MAKQSYSLNEIRSISECNYSTHIYPVMHPDRIIHDHDFVYILAGKWEIYQDSIKYVANKNDIILLHANQHHYSLIPCLPGTKVIYIHFSTSKNDHYELNDFPDAYNSNSDSKNIVTLPTIVHCQNNSQIFKILSDIVYIKATKEPFYINKMNSLLTLLLIELSHCVHKKNQAHNTLVSDIIKLFQNNPSVYYNSQDLSDLFFVSGKTINRHFLKAYGKTMHAYQQDMKLDSIAQYILLYPDSTLHAVSLNHGFYDEFHMSKAFKKRFKVSPNLYRKQYINNYIQRKEKLIMEGMKVKKITSLEKVLPKTEPTGNGWKDTISICVGETYSFQIAYYWDKPQKQNGQITIHSPEQLHIHARTVGSVPCAYPCHLETDDHYLSNIPGLYPDLLQEITEYGFPIISGQWRSLWIEINALEAGAHSIEIELTNSSQDILFEKITLNINVIPAIIPKNPIPHTEWFHCDCLANYYDVDVFSEKHWEIIENFVKTAMQRGCNMLLTPIFTPPLDTKVGGERRTVQLVDVAITNGKYSFGYDKFERWVEMCKRCGVLYFEISHLFSQWGATAAPKIMATVDGQEQQLFGWHTNASSPEYTNFLHEFLTSFVSKLDSMGIAEQCYFHVSDEPSLEQINSYKAAKEIVQEHLNRFHMIDALSNYAFYEAGLVNEPVCATNHMDPFLEKRPERLWAYYCTGQYKNVSNRFIAMPGNRTRILGLQLYKHDINGFLHWGFNFYNSQYSLYPINPYQITDADGAFPSGDAFLVYPGPDGKPEESIRIMLMQEAFQDLAAMKYLESIAGRSCVMECLQEDQNVELKFDQYPTNISYILEVRERVNQQIAAHIK